MTHVENAIHRPEHANQVCNICGKPSAETICETCCNLVRADALDRKKHEEKPNS